MSVNFTTKQSRNKKKIWRYLEWGKEAGQRRAIDVFTYAIPLDSIQKNHNTEALAII